MAIIIPSKNIYDISDNNKVLDNKISSVSVDATAMVSNNQYDTIVASHTIFNPEVASAEDKEDIAYTTDYTQLIDTYAYAYAAAYQKDAISYSENTAEYSTEIENGYISKLTKTAPLPITDGSGVEISYFGDILTQKITAEVFVPTQYKWGFDTWQDDFKKHAQKTSTQYGETTVNNNTALEIPTMPIKTEISASGISDIVVAEGVDNKSMSYVAFINNNKDLLLISREIAEFSTESMTGKVTEYGTTTDNDFPRFAISGTKTTYIVKEIRVSINGNTIEYKVEKNNQFYGDASQKPISYESNELLQETATAYGTKLPQHISEQILKNYKNGKETAILKCSIGEYYYDDGNFALSTKRDYDASGVSVGYQDYGNYVEFWLEEQEPLPYDVIVGYSVYENGLVDSTNTTIIPKGFISVTEPLEEGNQTMWSVDKIYTNDKIPMTFAIGDIVIPHIIGSNGVETPMSIKTDGSPKEFRVIGTHIYFDGAVWQELTLQEI
jgi:hypothetical protein